MKNPIAIFVDKRMKALEAKRDRALIEMVRRALSLPAVQQAIADTFSGSTPMCFVLRQAIESGVEEHGRNNVSADDIDGLDKYIENYLEEFKKEAMDDTIKEIASRLRG